MMLLVPLAWLSGLVVAALYDGRFRLRHAANAAPLLALALAIGSGKCMDEQWLRRGELHHLAYNLHLVAWALLAVRSNDGPRQWPAQLSRWWRGR